METVKLYYEDCMAQEFTARVLDCRNAGDGFAVILDATAFYPEGGGQACDTGTLNDANVYDVREKDGDILHFCDKKLKIGSIVTGKICWERRFDLMQQHSGEHIVSGLVNQLCGFQNVGFHMGSEVMEIDFDGVIAPQQLQQIEDMANQAVWADLPIHCWYPSEAELPNVTYRSKRALPWPVRIVQVPGYDSCACCGVHVKTTGQIGLIKILSCTKLRGGVRLELTCGSRALRLVQAIFEQNRLVSQAFSAKILETGTAAQKMNDALAAEKLRANTLQTQVFDHVAAGYADRGNVWLFDETLQPAMARVLADKIAQVCGGWAAVFTGVEGNFSLCIVSRQEDVKSIGQALGARGGGKPGFFQGSVQQSKAAIEEILQRL